MTAREHLLEALEHITLARQLSDESAAHPNGTVNLTAITHLEREATLTYQRVWEGGISDKLTTRFTR